MSIEPHWKKRGHLPSNLRWELQLHNMPTAIHFSELDIPHLPFFTWALTDHQNNLQKLSGKYGKTLPYTFYLRKHSSCKFQFDKTWLWITLLVLDHYFQQLSWPIELVHQDLDKRLHLHISKGSICSALLKKIEPNHYILDCWTQIALYLCYNSILLLLLSLRLLKKSHPWTYHFCTSWKHPISLILH